MNYSRKTWEIFSTVQRVAERERVFWSRIMKDRLKEMKPLEALLWLSLSERFKQLSRDGTIDQNLLEECFQQKQLDELRRRLEIGEPPLAPESIPLLSVLSIQILTRTLSTFREAKSPYSPLALLNNYTQGLTKYGLTLFPAEIRAELRPLAHTLLSSPSLSELPTDDLRFRLALAAVAELHGELYPSLMLCPPLRPRGDDLHEIALALPDPTQIARVFERHSLPFISADYLQRYLEGARENGIPYLLTALSKSVKEDALTPLLEFSTPGVALVILSLWSSGKATKLVRRWFERDPDLSLRLLLALLEDRCDLSSAVGDAILHFGLADPVDVLMPQLAYSSSGHRQLRLYLEEIAEFGTVWLASDSLPTWWREALGSEVLEQIALPEWLNVDKLPAIRVESRSILPHMVVRMIKAFKISKPDKPAPIIRAALANGLQADLFTLVETLLDQWVDEGACDWSDRWVLEALHHVPGEKKAGKLFELFHSWNSSKGYHKHTALLFRVIAGLRTEEGVEFLRSVAASKKTTPAIRKEATVNFGIAERVLFEQKHTSETTAPRLLLEPEDSLPTSGSRRNKRLRRATFDWHWCLKQFRTQLPSSPRNYTASLPADLVDVEMTKPEAYFWLIALRRLRSCYADHPDLFSLYLLDRHLSQDEIREILKTLSPVPDCVVPLLHSLLGAADALMLLHSMSISGEISVADSLPLWVVERLLPALADSEIDELRHQVGPLLSSALLNEEPWIRTSLLAVVAGSLGFQDELIQIIQSLPSQELDRHWHQDRNRNFLLMLLVSLRDPKIAIKEAIRLKVRLRSEREARRWLALTQWEGLKLITQSVIATDSVETRNELVRALVLAQGKETAIEIEKLFKAGVVLPPLIAWIHENPSYSLPMLVRASCSEGVLGTIALKVLTSETLKCYGTEIQQEIAAIPDPPESSRLYSHFHAPHPPPDLQGILLATEARAFPWLNIALLPRLVFSTGEFPPSLIPYLLTALCDDASIIPLLRKHTSPPLLADFSWCVFEQWHENGAPPEDKWVLSTLSSVGNDDVAIKLAPRISQWARGGQHARAGLGLKVLRDIGSDMALRLLNVISKRGRYKAIKAKAQGIISEIARSRGLTKDELEDRIVPDLGLDDHGVVLLHKDSTLTARLEKELHFVLLNDKGQQSRRFPSPSDEVTREAKRSWTQLRKNLMSIVSEQSKRLEKTMIDQRCWRLKDLQSLLVAHPLMSRLIQHVIFETFDADSQRRATICLGPDHKWRDEENKTAEPLDFMRIPHPVTLPQEVLDRWGTLLKQDDNVELFPLIHRVIHRPRNDEAETYSLSRFEREEISSLFLIGSLEKNDWVRDGGDLKSVVKAHTKRFAQGVVAELRYKDELALGFDPGFAELGHVQFFKEERAGEREAGVRRILHLREVPAIIFSEVVLEISELVSKSKKGR